MHTSVVQCSELKGRTEESFDGRVKRAGWYVSSSQRNTGKSAKKSKLSQGKA